MLPLTTYLVLTFKNFYFLYPLEVYTVLNELGERSLVQLLPLS